MESDLANKAGSDNVVCAWKQVGVSNKTANSPSLSSSSQAIETMVLESANVQAVAMRRCSCVLRALRPQVKTQTAANVPRENGTSPKNIRAKPEPLRWATTLILCS